MAFIDGVLVGAAGRLLASAVEAAWTNLFGLSAGPAFHKLQQEWRDELVGQYGKKYATALQEFFARKTVLDELAKVRDDRLDQVDFDLLDAELRDCFRWAGTPALGNARRHLRRWWRDLEALIQPNRIKVHEMYRKQYLRAVYKQHRFIRFTGLAEVTGPPEVELARLFEMPRVLRQAESGVRERTGQPEPVKAFLLARSLEGSRLVLLGKPGAGKTTLSECFAFATAAQALADEAALPAGFEWAEGIAQLPVFYRIRDLVKDQKAGESLRPCWYRNASRRLGLELPPWFFEREADTGGLLLLLDGLDEAGSPGRRNELVDEIGRFADLLPDSCTVIVTTRPHDYAQRRFDPSSFAHFELCDFNDDEIQSLIHRWSAAHARDPQDAQEKEQRLWTALEGRGDLHELARNALLLTMIVRVHFGLGTLPDSRLDLYAKCVDTLLEHWSAPGDLGKSPVERSVKHDFLAKLAFELQREAGESLRDREIALRVERDDLARRLRRYLHENCPDAVSRVDETIDRLHKRDAILVSDGGDGFRFLHRSFQEYFAACWMAQQLSHDEFDEIVAEDAPGWNETLYLAVARIDHKPRRYAVLQDLLKTGRVPFALEAMKAARRSEPWLETLILFLARYFLDGSGPSAVECADRCGARKETADVLDGLFRRENRDGRALASAVELAKELLSRGDTLAGNLLDGFFAESKNFGLDSTDKMAWCEGFYMDKFLVTNRDFECMIPARRRERVRCSDQDDQPVVHVNWWEAALYCEWRGAGFRLPSNEEWYKAAAWDPDRKAMRKYP
jgi:hypothetical protein